MTVHLPRTPGPAATLSERPLTVTCPANARDDLALGRRPNPFLSRAYTPACVHLKIAVKSQKSPRFAVSISGELRRRINQAAHAEGLRQEIAARNRIVRELRFLAAKGAGVDEIGAYLDRLEQT